MNDLTAGAQLQLFLRGRKHLVGSLAALAGLGLFFGGIIATGWWAIVLGLYAAGVLLTPTDDASQRLARARYDEHNLRECLQDLLKVARNRVPAEAGHLLQAIQGHAELLLPKLKELTEEGSLASSVRHDVVQTLTRYHPDTLASYFKLPTGYARLQGAGGKTPETLLVDQLRLLGENPRGAMEEAFSSDVSNLEVHGRFLSEKFRVGPE